MSLVGRCSKTSIEIVHPVVGHLKQDFGKPWMVHRKRSAWEGSGVEIPVYETLKENSVHLPNQQTSEVN